MYLDEIVAVNDLHSVRALQVFDLLDRRLHHLDVALVRVLNDVGQTAHDATADVDDVTLVGSHALQAQSRGG